MSKSPRKLQRHQHRLVFDHRKVINGHQVAIYLCTKCKKEVPVSEWTEELIDRANSQNP